MQLKPNTELQNGKYKILRMLGQGGFGITYLAEHTMLDKQVAIKEFFPKEYCDREETTSQVTLGSKNTTELVGALKNKFVKEAKNISKLRHPNIITIHDIFEENSTAYYVMEYIEGNSLSDTIKQNGALEEKKAVEYILKIADAVGYMHSLSMNHLDLKPANIMVRKEDGEPVLIDFGLSKQYDASGGQTSTTPIGISHGYAPIEQYRPGGVATFTPQTDIYALGATLYALLSGKTPPHYSEILEDGLPELSSNVSIQTKDTVEHAMEIKKNKRPENILQFIKELSYNEDNKIIKDTNVSSPEIKQEEPSYSNNKKEDVNVSNSSTQKVIEQTIIIPKENPIENKLKENIENLVQGNNSNFSEHNPSETLIINGIEFIDLGLSVKWANKNIGAENSYNFGISINKNNIEDVNLVKDFKFKRAKIPTIGQWEELRNNCNWERIEIDNIEGYKVTGKNGNSIFLPFNGDVDTGSFGTFGRLFTRETFDKSNPNSSDNYYFYFTQGGTYKLTKYGLFYKCPVRLIFQS